MTASAHLLLVEDERSIREPLARLLEREGFRVTQAGDAVRARQLLLESALDLAILDIMLPGEDGLSLARFIRASSDLPLIMLTARSCAAPRQRARQRRWRVGGSGRGV